MEDPKADFNDQTDAFWASWEKLVKLYPEARNWLPARGSDELLAMSPDYCASVVQKAVGMLESDQRKQKAKKRR